MHELDALQVQARNELDNNNKNFEALKACILCNYSPECEKLFKDKKDMIIDKIKSCPIIKQILNS